MESLFDVCFAGQLLDGQELQDVRQKVQKLFNATPETLDKLFSGKTQLVKRGCDQATAAKYKQAMARAGILAIVRTCEASAAQTTAPAAEQREESAEETGLNLSPAGSDVLRPEERIAPVAVDVDISKIKLTAAGTDLSDAVEASGTPPDTSHLSMGEVGEDIPNLADTRTQLNPDTDSINLSPAGTGFSDCAPPEADTPTLDLSSIELAPAGSDVLEERYKKTDNEEGPDTDHISLED